MEKLSRFIWSHELPAYGGLQRTQIDFLISQGDFPKPLKLSARRKGWLESELLEWQTALIAERDSEPRQ
jgi:predicted DNA-binding transcriptional regulator AlpA